MTEAKETEQKQAAAKVKVKADKVVKEKRAVSGRPRRWPGLLSLLIAAAAASGVWYLWQELQVMNQSLSLSLQQTRDDSARSRDELQGMQRDNDNRLALVEQKLLAMRGKDNMDWLVSEAEYLIRIANHRLLLEHDVHAALTALKAADSRLYETQDPYWLGVRNQLARDIATLEALPAVDLAGLSLRINSLGEAILQMPILKPERFTPARTATAEEPRPEARYWSEVWDDLKQRLGRLVVIRQVDRPPGPLLEPQQAAYLQQNLLLRLEQVKLALLRGEEQLYRDGLQSSREWIESYYDTGSSATREVLRHLTALHEMQIRPALPDISPVLTQLAQARLQRSKDQRSKGEI